MAASISTSHLVLIPSYNSGAQLLTTVQSALAQWAPIWVVVDGSTDQSGQALLRYLANTPGLENRLRVIVQLIHQGKGAAALEGADAAHAAGFSEALTMDGDVLHPAHFIPPSMTASVANPDAMILRKQ